MPDSLKPEDLATKPVNEVVNDVLQQSENALRGAAQAAADLQELKRRSDEALDWRKQLSRHNWAPIAIAAGVSLLIGAIITRRG